MSEHDFDLLVIGAGSGGVRAARMAAGRGVRVGIIEDRYWGGTCVNVGCVPKKLYSYAAHFGEDFADAAGYGWNIGTPQFDWPVLRDNRAREILRLNGVYNRLLDNSGVTRIEGRGKILSAHSVQVGEKTYSAERLLITTGSWPYIPDFPGSEHCITSNEVFDLPVFPKRFLVYGGGYIAVEFASIFKGLGAETTLVYRGNKLLRGFDEEVRDFVQEEIGAHGVKLLLEQEIQSLERKADKLLVTLADGSQLTVDAVLCATGRRGNLAGLGLENVGLKANAQGEIPVDEHFCTEVPSIYALGDVTGGPQLTPVALAEAMVLVHNLYSGEAARVMNYDNIPTAVFCHPNISTVGLSEEKARQVYGEIRVYSTSFRPMRNTLSGNPGRCLMKLVVDDASDKVVGCHVVGPEAGEIVQGMGIAVKAGLTKADFDATLGIHPTSAEELVTLRSLTRR
ncbi:glutathione-disulfide reductase [Marinospirillum alkaliphilum]|uniref:NADPH-glutathione reductase n=1 Tax=Marinospirillum alkaliphilum DSM 21637 TaxID=1122209 RepID=A0A1K1XKX5_9GAMM|nr:glutathione-disulfide reductase [Marinospirillum alkaliphilum]SFX50255.1 NADPH-glutathione reductase [Marinospirillum alkaliphilum DSM 21637]